MDKFYVVVVRVENVQYLQLWQADGGYAISAFDTKEAVLEQFDSFKGKILTGSYESHISGSMGIINLNPHIIEVPKSDPQVLAEYLIEDKPYTLKGGMFGAFVDFAGVKVKSEILNLSVYDVAKEYMAEARS